MLETELDAWLRSKMHLRLAWRPIITLSHLQGQKVLKLRARVKPRFLSGHHIYLHHKPI